MWWRKFKRGAGGLNKFAEAVAKAIASVTAIVAALAFLCPAIGGWVNMLTARRFGVTGYAFYEVAPDPKKVNKDDPAIGDSPLSLTNSGNFYAPRARSRLFEGIDRGDLLQAGSAAYLHAAPTKNSAVIYRFRDGECALVIERTKPEPPQPNYSGGWFKVATAACGLFK